MSTTRWSRATLGLAVCAGLAITAGCASSGATPREGEAVSPADSAARELNTRRSRGTTGANRLTREDIENARASDIATLIETKLPGVSVTRRGADYVVRIRGMSSFMSSTNALVLIDGVEGNLGSVPIHDIQSIEVLKDSAAAIYGVRGANGVLLVTTQRR